MSRNSARHPGDDARRCDVPRAIAALGIMLSLAIVITPVAGGAQLRPQRDAAVRTSGNPNQVLPRAGAAGGLQPEGDGQIVHDANANAYWLANANLAGDAAVRAKMGVAGIEPNGMMDYPTALKWVAALNAYDGGAGWLGHNNWQLPGTPMLDATCGAQGPQGASFGALCENDAPGSLYNAGLNRKFPESVVLNAGASVGPSPAVRFEHVQLSYYWTEAKGGLNGRKVFSFGAGDGDATTINDSYYYVLPMVKGEVGAHASCASGGLVPYTSGPAANVAVYDCAAQDTWPLDANLAASRPFDISTEVRIVEKRPWPRRQGNATTVTAPPIVDGAMLFTTANEWIAALNAQDRGAGWLGHKDWQLPDIGDVRALYSHLHLTSSDSAKFQVVGSVGPFRNLQPFFYWEKCVPESIDMQSRWTSGAEDCVKGNAPPGKLSNQMNYDYTFGYGIQATDVGTLKYFVMVYYPDPKARPKPPANPPQVGPGRTPQFQRGVRRPPRP